MKLVFLALALTSVCLGQSLPSTEPLSPDADFSATMVAGIDRMATRLTEQSKVTRKPTAEKLAAILGIVDKREPIRALELIGDSLAPALLAETPTARILRVRWPVLAGLTGEGLWIQPKDKPVARVIYLPDADTEPEKLAKDAMLAYSGCEILIPALISRDSEFSTNAKFGIRTNVPHREWIYRQSFELGRHVIGYEIQMILSLLDYFDLQPDKPPVLVAGLGEGGLIALYSAALDTRIDCAYVWGYFGPREQLASEPLYRNVFGLLRDFGDAEIASLVAPRPLVVHHLGFPKVDGPPAAKKGDRNIAAPGKIRMPSLEAVNAEVARARQLVPQSAIKVCTEEHGVEVIVNHLFQPAIAQSLMSKISSSPITKANMHLPVDETRQERLVRQMEIFTQRLLVSTEAERHENFWKKLPLSSVPEFEKHTATERDRFWNEVIGRLPDPDLPIHAKSRLVLETEKVTIHEVTMDVWQDVFAWGWLCLPKDLKPGEKRPVIVCQHGLEGLPEDCVNTDSSTRAYAAYKAFALRLSEQGFITFCPHNPYRGKDSFRTLQRKLNPLGLTLYSVINGQHQRILEWLKSQPFTQPDKIAFYGLSYGGKSAMRTPAVLTDYCLSICSGDFNEWVRKCVSMDMPMSYVATGEYEIWEWNMGRTFNYAEMAALIAPRPFMVERGHDDGVGTDEWVNYEYAKVRRLYNKLKIGERTEIEHFDGPHTINGTGTFEFLKQHLDWPRK
jgi:cephalosporin-C deacetylase-like acetyl esterase